MGEQKMMSYNERILFLGTRSQTKRIRHRSVPNTSIARAHAGYIFPLVSMFHMYCVMFIKRGYSEYALSPPGYVNQASVCNFNITVFGSQLVHVFGSFPFFYGVRPSKASRLEID